MDHETAEVIKRHFNVVAENLRSDIRLVIEGLGANTDRLDRVEGRLDGLEIRFDGLEIRFDGLKTEFGALANQFQGLRSEFRELRERIEPLILREDN
jgi:chromosome segregation ATPase